MVDSSMQRPEVERIRREHHGFNVALSYEQPIQMVSARGCRMVDETGTEWLDCVNNVAHVGHCEPLVRGGCVLQGPARAKQLSACAVQVVQAQCEQLATLNTNSRYLSAGALLLTCSRSLSASTHHATHAVHSEYVRALADRFPPELSVSYLVNSGSEANDLALRIARAARPGHSHVAVMEGAYHGHVTSMVDCSPYKFWGAGGAGAPPHVHVMPIPDTYRCEKGGKVRRLCECCGTHTACCTTPTRPPALLPAC